MQNAITEWGDDLVYSDQIDLLGLDEFFQPVSYIPFINLQWKRRYYEVGTFTIQILAKDYDSRIRYVYAHQRPELGVIERRETQHEIKGDFTLLSGRFIEHVLSWRLAYPHIKGNYTLQALSEHFIRHEWYKLDIYDIIVPGDLPANTVDVGWENDPLGECMYETLKTLEMSQRIVFNPDDSTLTYRIWQGVDRTQSQSENPFAVFSDESCYVTSFKYIEDISNYKNVAMILYGSGPSRSDYYIGGEYNIGSRWMLMNGDESDGLASLKQQAHEELQKHPIVQEAEINVIQNEFFYLKDYDLGDKCDIVGHNYGVAFEGRLSTVDEVWKQGKHTVKLGFGEQAQTQYQRLKFYARADRKAH